MEGDILRNGVLENNDKLRAIDVWNKNFHPLTCGNEGCREVLKGFIQDSEVILKCKCGYIQKYVPDVVYNHYKKFV